MGREVRKVPADWQHPKNKKGFLQPQYDEDYEEKLAEWLLEREKWKSGFVKNIINEFVPKDERHEGKKFEDWSGPAPDYSYYMEQFPNEKKTHYMMYETTSEGTPISPAFETPEKLAEWLAENKASAFANIPATYEQWLRMITGPGSSCGAVLENGVLKSGVAADV